MPTSRVSLLRWQFDLTWSLFEYHLDRLNEADTLWQPAKTCWTVHRSEDGHWLPDWSEEELDPVPVPTIAWITWHIGWWWSVTIDHMRQRTPRERTEVTWPGGAASTVEWLRDLSAEWVDVLDGLVDEDLDAGATFPWQVGTDLTVGHTLAWLNTELAKNVSEIGQLRLVRAAA
ncbi:DinB family protein [Pseudonocardia endophytica]|uniref:DinB family protein n=1 Tax=Pseudonocardia endophytica TaxID=401976 RepID=A0A4R1HZN1_PSEEN|nr:DinB family protein [Pseudonocardia endophytica]TCK27043.1 DinB family protein [Pseudonocardia endophytica]